MAYVMIIEDDRAIGLAMRVHLQGDGYRVELCGDGEAGMIRVLREQPDVIFLDYMMPQLDGFAVLPLLAERHLADRVVVVTALTSSAAQEYAEKFGAEYLRKPFNNRELTAAAQRVLAKRFPVGGG